MSAKYARSGYDIKERVQWIYVQEDMECSDPRYVYNLVAKLNWVSAYLELLLLEV